MLDSLKYQFKKQKQDNQVISGSIKGLTCFLTNSYDELKKIPNGVSDLYKYVCLGALNPPEGTKVYHIPKGKVHDCKSHYLAAMVMIYKHATLFRQYLTEQSPKIYSYLKNYCLHINKKVRQIAFLALESFFTEVSNEIVDGNRNPQNDRETFTVSYN